MRFPLAACECPESAQPRRCRSLRRGSLNRTYNGHSGPTAGTGLHAPNPTFRVVPKIGSMGWAIKLPMLALDLRAARLHEYSELRTAGEEPSVR
jgi:hypothetical protein